MNINSINYIILEEYKKIIDENFYYLEDTEFTNPITNNIFQKIINNLPGLKTKKVQSIKASGAEGIVLSLDDYRVVKLFFNVENAGKLIPFLNKNLSFTSNIYSMGTIKLDKKIKYYKKGSKYSDNLNNTETDKIYYIVMERIIPDNEIYLNLENKYINLVLLSKIQNIDSFIYYLEFIKKENNKYLEYYVKERILDKFLKKNSIQNISSDDIYNTSFKLEINKGELNKIHSTFLNWKKSEPNLYLFVYGDNFSPLLFKNFLWVYLGKYNLQYDLTYVINNYYNILNNKDKTDFNELYKLLYNIIIENNIIWYDIHKDQFGRTITDNKLVAIDIGVKNSNINYKEFNKNIISLNI
jgi:hypothetical protein